jgi:hypothetical protein
MARLERYNEMMDSQNRSDIERRLATLGNTGDGSREVDLPIESISGFTVKSLHALIFRNKSIRFATVYVANLPLFWCIDFHENGRVTIEVGLENPIPFSVDEFSSVCDAIFTSVGASMDNCNIEGDIGEAPRWVTTLAINDHQRSIGRLEQCIKELAAETSIRNGSPARSPASKARMLSFLQQGDVSRVVGEAENSWLEFKSYLDVSDDASRIELSQDVARFANSESGGILAFGYRTKKSNSQDVVVKATPFRIEAGIEERLRNIIDSRVYPPIRGLGISRTPMGESLYGITILIPSQLESEKPFLVHGAMVSGKMEGVFFSIIRRRGEGSIPVTAYEVHSLLAAGYKVLRSLKLDTDVEKPATKDH